MYKYLNLKLKSPAFICKECTLSLKANFCLTNLTPLHHFYFGGKYMTIIS